MNVGRRTLDTYRDMQRLIRQGTAEKAETSTWVLRRGTAQPPAQHQAAVPPSSTEHHKTSKMAEDFHTEQAERDPFQYVRLLGHGSFGVVDEVVKIDEPEATHYARKQFRLPYYRRNEKIEEIKKEARIIRRLHHRHIVQVVETVLVGTQLSIIMLPVADGDLLGVLEKLDSQYISPNLRSNQHEVDIYMSQYVRLLRWPGCLIRALDYMHEMRVKHRDIKPSNILVKGDDVFFTDFGIAKEVISEETTGSYDTVGPCTWMYSAPEVAIDGARRGRATDIYSLGCVFLELATVQIYRCMDELGQGALGELREFYHSEPKPIAYSSNQRRILKWMWILFNLHSYECFSSPDVRFELRKDLIHHGKCLVQLAFLMMDPDPDKRITARQLAALLNTNSASFSVHVNRKACKDCATTPMDQDKNIPPHSTFCDVKLTHYDLFGNHEAKEIVHAEDWEDAKRKWLSQHMWWD